MSGLAVIADWSSPGVSVEPVRRMLARVPHRGGDGTSALCRGPCAMGFAHRVRMARQRGAPQPFDDPRRGLVVVADARLDNRAELCALLAPGRAHDVCDAELIARGYDRWGTRLAERLLGDFALVVWDSNRQELYAARDPFATRPLYYRRFTGARNGPAAALASEVEQLLALEPGAAPIERRLVLDYLLGDYRHPRETFFQGIFRVLPGHWAVLSRSGVREARYWHPPKDPIRLPDDRAYAGELGRLLRQAVESRLESDGPLLAHLSGGIDSSSVVCIAHAICQEAKASVPAITLASAVYPGLACDESALIERVARSTRFPSLRWDGRVSSWAVGERPRTAYPWSDMESAGFGGDYVLAARLGARVLLTGYGGDEVFFERGVFRDLVAQGRWLRLIRELRGSDRYSSHSARFFLTDAVRVAAPAWLRRAYRVARPRPPAPAPAWLGPQLRETWRERAEPTALGEISRASHTQRCSWDWLTSPNLWWGIEQRQLEAARCGLELRFPLLDARVAQFVLAVPYTHRLPAGRMKRLLRDAVADRLPREVAQRRKITSFESVLRLHLERSLPWLRSVLCDDPQWVSEPYVVRQETRAFLEGPGAQLSEGAAAQPCRLAWNMATLETWLRQGAWPVPGAKEDACGAISSCLPAALCA